MRIIVVPSWFPSPQAPLSGIFFAEQTELLASHAPSLDVHVFAVPRRNYELAARRPLEAVRVLAAWWRADKHDVKVAAPNYAVHGFETLTWTDHVAHGGLLHEAGRMAEVAKTIERERGPIDLVHAHVSYPGGFVAAELARTLGVPLVVSEHMSPFPFVDLCSADGIPRADVLAPIRSASRVTAVSRAHAQSIERFVDRPIDVMPNFIDETRFSSAGHAPHVPFRFLSVGHLVPQKGFDILLRALRLCLDQGVPVHLSVVGEGYQGEELRTLAAELGVTDSVDWLGAPDRGDMPAIYRDANAFVLASRHESFGVVVIEALASGLPVVATRCGGPEEIITEESGMLVPPEDPSALAMAMTAMARRHYDADTIRGYFDRTYSAAAVVPRLLELYESVLGERRGAAARSDDRAAQAIR